MNRNELIDFLLTYGWAILVVLVAVGILAYYNVLSPDSFRPSFEIMNVSVAP